MPGIIITVDYLSIKFEVHVEFYLTACVLTMMWIDASLMELFLIVTIYISDFIE